jgi:hypothetical protein
VFISLLLELFIYIHRTSSLSDLKNRSENVTG